MLSVILEKTAADPFARMADHLGAFTPHMAVEFAAWQVEDMRRRQPDVRDAPNVVETTILPRGKPRSAEKVRVYRRAPPRRSTRPILRPELYERLARRMTDLMAEELTWR